MRVRILDFMSLKEKHKDMLTLSVNIAVISLIFLNLLFGLITLINSVSFIKSGSLEENFSIPLSQTSTPLIIITFLVIIAKILFSLKTNKKKSKQGVKLQIKILSILSLLILIPAILTSIFAHSFIKNNEHHTIPPTLEKSLEESSLISEIYLKENQEFLNNSMISLKQHVESKTKNIIISPSQFEKEFSDQAKLLSLTEAIVFIHNDQNNSNKIVAQTDFTFTPKAEDFSIKEKFKPNKSGYQIITNTKNNYIRFISTINTLPNAYLIIGKSINDIAVKNLENSEEAKSEFAQIKEAITKSRENITSIFFTAINLLIITFILAAILLSDFIISPLVRIIEGSEKLASGKLHLITPVSCKVAPLQLVIKSFNHMTKTIIKDRKQINQIKDNSDIHKDFLTNLLGNLPSAIIFIDDQENIKLHNKAAEKLLEKTNLSNSKISTHIPEIVSFLTQSKESISFTKEIKINGKIKKLLLYVTPDVHESEIKGYIINFSDLTK